ncbi:unnamed protein product [Candida verbasci]|uniref:Vacuolar segregation protein 7 n=1 Tax=Candida verbasci TaxID=1227364 RepID=A0A9W4TXZ2_9ASCO|nr:unnamed protein product [Candida verbasci]
MPENSSKDEVKPSINVKNLSITTNDKEQALQKSHNNNKSSTSLNSSTPPSILNKNTISNINKSLKAKQKIIHLREPHPKNPTFISNIINTSPQQTAFPIDDKIIPNKKDNEELFSLPTNEIQDKLMLHSNSSNINNSTTEEKKPQRKIAKQNSTRTDFFAAKLASAVDDVESSDSDETFVYENNNKEENASINGSIPTTSHRAPSILDEQHPETKPFKLTSNKAPSIANSMNSSNYLESVIKKTNQPRALSTYSTNEALLPPPQPQSQPQHDRQSINEYNDDTFSYNEIEDDIDESSDDEEEKNNTTLIASSAQPQAPNTTPSISSKNTTKKNYKSSTSSSKLRSTTSKLFDKKGSQPRRYSTIPDDIDIEDFDDELIYYDNNVRFPHNESSSLLNNQKIPHYRSLNLSFQPNMKRQNKRYLSTGQPLDNKFPFPYQEPQQHSSQFYYDFDDYDQESQNYDPNFDLPDMSMNRKISRKFSPNSSSTTHHQRFHHLFPRKIENKKSSCCKSFIYTFFSILFILTVGFILGFVLATTKDLTGVGITSIENPIVSKDELVFNIVVEAFNPGWFSVDIDQVDLDLFARSGYLDDGEDNLITSDSSKVETFKLGTILNLESTMNFKGGFFSREPTIQKGEIKLLNPGKNITIFNNKTDYDDNSQKWEKISSNPFDLIITGVLKYELPLIRNTKSVVVRKTGYIDPTLYPN